jgi:CheY-like chemotaxis protein
MTSPVIDDRRHTLTLDVPRGLVVEADASRLAQVVANLLTNAAKYTDPGGQIRIVAQPAGTFVRATITDNGRGIDPEMLPRIFDLFSQEGQELDRSQGGLGLGLAIVKNLLEAHGGSVQAHSEGKGRGAVFSLEVPLAELHSPDREPSAPAASAAESSKLGLRILIIDDNIDAAELLGETLRTLGHTTHIAFDGPSAIQAAPAFRPQVALIDLGLPVMDGFDVARALRSLPETANIPLIAVTGYGQESDRRRTREAGFEEHLVKPIDVEQLESWLHRRAGRYLSVAR